MKVSTIAFCLAALGLSPDYALAAATEVAQPASFVVSQTTARDKDLAPLPVVIWAPATGRNLPLIVISHGTGAGPLSHVDTAQALAQAGFVVVAPLHSGDNFQDDSAVGKPAWFVNRSSDVSRVIDYMLVGWTDKGRLNKSRIGIFGFSAGGTTALISIGAVPDLQMLGRHCAAEPEFVCRIMAPPSADTPQWRHDRRVKAAVVAAPGIGFAFPPHGLAQVRTPVQLWYGTADGTVPYASNGAIVEKLLPEAPEVRQVDNAVHYSFLAPCGPETPPFLCQDTPGFDRTAFHGEFNQSIIGFFRQKLPGRRN